MPHPFDNLVKFGVLAMNKKANCAGCRSCRYYLQTVSECLKENRRGDLMRSGLIGQCSEFKEIQGYLNKNETAKRESALDSYFTPHFRE